MNERERMIRMWQSNNYSKSELARQCGVTRQCVHKWIARYEEDEIDGLEERSRAPHHVPNRTSPETIEQLVALKLEHSDLGPAKLVEMMADREGRTPLAASTAGEILKRHGLVQPSKRRRPNGVPTAATPLDTVHGRVMTTDFKGQFRLGNRRLCYPLTLADPLSRFIYAIDALDSTAVDPAQRVFERVFRQFGLPDVILSDNGVPFCCPNALGGLSALSVWWIKLGIQPQRIEPGKPQQNGRHERMHRTLKKRTTNPPERTKRKQQQGFDRFRYEFNYLRPHSALGQRPPASALEPFTRSFPKRLCEIVYPDYFEVRRVRSNGQIKWNGTMLFASTVLIGELVGLEPVADGRWDLYFGPTCLARLDERKKRWVKRPKQTVNDVPGLV